MHASIHVKELVELCTQSRQAKRQGTRDRLVSHLEYVLRYSSMGDFSCLYFCFVAELFRNFLRGKLTYISNAIRFGEYKI